VVVDSSLSVNAPVNVGDIVDKYRIERVIGVGAMGLVVAARHTTLDQIVAIKFLVEHRFGSKEESIARFLGEARAAAKIDSDHICRVSDVGMLPNGVPYMIMEYLEGHDLEEEIVSRGQLDVIEGVDFLLQALDAIAAAHAVGIVHRDLKPANLFLALRPDGSRRVKVLDFGISKAQSSSGKQRYTRDTKSLGTPAYMPPEQIKDPMGVDHRADIWALGAILYEVLTGQMAFVGGTIKEVLDRVLGEDPCPIDALRRDVPPELIAIVARSLMRDREDRWQTAATFARALAYFGSIGVLGTLTNISREVGSLASISAVRVTPMQLHQQQQQQQQQHQQAQQVPQHAQSVEPMVASVSREMTTQPDPSEVSRRHTIQQDWTARKKRERSAKNAVFVMVAAFFFASSVALIVYRFGRPAFIFGPRSGEQSRVAAAPPPPSTTETAPPPLASTAPATPTATPSASVARPPPKNVYPATSGARPSHPATKKPSGSLPPATRD
jgi:serine/threonine protein kinase